MVIIEYLLSVGRTNTSSITFDGRQFEASTGGSYQCNADTTINLGQGVTMETWNLQYFAFENKTRFGSDSMYRIYFTVFSISFIVRH